MNKLKVFKELILKYESITSKDIEESESYAHDMSLVDEVWLSETIMEELTGYGKTNKCTLCKNAGIQNNNTSPDKLDCSECAWIEYTGDQCFTGKNHKTYDAFQEVEIDSEDALVDACHARAEYMRSVIDWWDKKIG